MKYILRYQDRIRADIQTVPDNEQIKLIETIDLKSLVYCSSKHTFLVGNCIEKSKSYCPGCVKFQECESTKNVNLTFYCWGLGRPCQDMQSWFTKKVDFDFNDDFGYCVCNEFDLDN